MSQQPIQTAIIGVGHLGNFHVEQLLQIPEAELVGIYDEDPEAAARQQKRHKLRIFDSLKEALESAEAISVVVPTVDHFAVASRGLEAGCHVFIEKPITQTLLQADQLLQLAEERSLLIQVGHIERLNPALQVLESLAPQPRFIEGHRLASFSSRGTDVPVVLDLMIHDIDVVLNLVRSPLESVRANGVAVITDTADIATARLEFANGAVANLTASRVAQKQMRKLRLFQSHLYIGVDFLQQITEIYRLVGPDDTPPDALLSIPFEHNGRQRIITYEKPTVEKYNPLHMELTNFIRAVAGLEKPVVDGRAARAALDVASQVQAALDESTARQDQADSGPGDV